MNDEIKVNEKICYSVVVLETKEKTRYIVWWFRGEETKTIGTMLLPFAESKKKCLAKAVTQYLLWCINQHMPLGDVVASGWRNAACLLYMIL